MRRRTARLVSNLMALTLLLVACRSAPPCLDDATTGGIPLGAWPEGVVCQTSSRGLEVSDSFNSGRSIRYERLMHFVLLDSCVVEEFVVRGRGRKVVAMNVGEKVVHIQTWVHTDTGRYYGAVDRAKSTAHLHRRVLCFDLHVLPDDDAVAGERWRGQVALE